MKRFLLLLTLVISLFAAQAQTPTKYYYINSLTRLAKISNAFLLQIDTSGSGGWVSLTSSVYVNGLLGNKVNLNGSYSDPAWITSLAWSKISSKPTTISGYGITDPIVLTSGSYADPGWISSLGWSKIASKPTTLSGYGITDPVVVTSSTYNNPTWFTGLAFSKITGITGTPDGTKFLRDDGSWQPGSSTPSNLAVGTRTATTVPVTNSNGTGFTFPAADPSNAGAATADMYNKYLESFKSFYLRNAVTSAPFIKLLWLKNDSTAVAVGQVVESANNKLTVDTTQNTDSTKRWRITVNEANFTGIPQSAVTNLTSNLAAKQNTISVTTTGTSGAATFDGTTLNIPQYSGGGGGSTTVDVIVTRTLTNKDTANFNLSDLITAGYNVFEFFYQLKPAVDEDELFGRFSENGTTWVTASNYAWFQNYQLIAGSGNGWSGNAADHWGIGENVDGATTNTFGIKGQFSIINPNTAENRAISISHIKTEGSGTVVNHWGGLYYNGSSVLQGFQFYFSAGNIATGFIKLRASK